MPDDPKPSAAEIEAFCRRWANGRLHEDMVADFAATIATLTARAEAAEARCSGHSTELGKLRHWHASDERQRDRAEALAARVSELEAALQACAESLSLAREKLGMSGHGDGADRKADAGDTISSWGALNMARAALAQPKATS